jgi:hypothetical protein
MYKISDMEMMQTGPYWVQFLRAKEPRSKNAAKAIEAAVNAARMRIENQMKGKTL